MPFGGLDLMAIGVFLGAWLFYGHAVERWRGGNRSLNSRMNRYRLMWVEQALTREQRVFDSSIMATLQSGASFFASTTLIAMGGTLAFLRSTDDVLRLVSDLPFAMPPSRLAWEIKTIGLAFIFGYAFFKFAWSYRLFNYAAILLGALPSPASGVEGLRHAQRVGAMSISAGAHFNRGQRAIFFALAYLGWFMGALPLIVTTGLVLCSMWVRQFHSDALAAILDDDKAVGRGPPS